MPRGLPGGGGMGGFVIDRYIKSKCHWETYAGGACDGNWHHIQGPVRRNNRFVLQTLELVFAHITQ